MTLLDRWSAVMMDNYGTPPLALASGDGAVVTDVDGKSYIDLLGGIAVNVLGHRHPAVIEAVTRQMNTLGHTSNLYATEPGVALAEALVGLLGAPARVFFCNSGTEANEVASHFGSALRLDRPAPPFRNPTPAQLDGQEVGEDPVVQLRQADRRLEQRPRVEGAPPAVVDGLDPVQDDDVGVQLRVTGPRVPMLEHRRHDPTDVLRDHPAGPHPGGEDLPLGVPDDLLDGPLVGGPDPFPGRLVGQRPRHRHRLRRREGQVETGHRLRCRSDPTKPVDELGPRRRRGASERLSGHRVLQHPQHPPQLLLGDHRTRLDTGAVAESGQAGAEEPSRRRPVRGVVAGQAGRRAGLVHPRHRRHQVPEPGAQRHPPDRHRHNQEDGPAGAPPVHRAERRCQTCRAMGTGSAHWWDENGGPLGDVASHWCG